MGKGEKQKRYRMGGKRVAVISKSPGSRPYGGKKRVVKNSVGVKSCRGGGRLIAWKKEGLKNTTIIACATPPGRGFPEREEFRKSSSKRGDMEIVWVKGYGRGWRWG